MAVIKFILAALLLLSTTTVWAETYGKTFEEGQWVLYKVDDVDLAIFGAPLGRFDAVCLAEVKTPDSSLQISTMPPRLVETRPDLRDYVAVKVSKADWNFRDRQALVTLSVNISSYGDRKARYNGNSIGFTVTNLKSFRMFLMFAGVRRTIDVLDRRSKVIAQFSTDGFSAVRDKLFECAGL